jgi:signal transduction histidine kinase
VIERNADMQARLIEDLLDVSRIMVGQLRLQHEPVNIGRVIASALDAVRPALDNKAVEVSTTVDVGSTVYGDAARLEQVVWNLLTNAAKFTPAKGHVSVSAFEEDNVVRIVVLPAQGSTLLSWVAGPQKLERRTNSAPMSSRTIRLK